MIRMLSKLGAVVAGVFLLTALQTTPAQAFGGETFGCRIAPGHTFTFTEFCQNDSPTSTYYSVAFGVQNLSGTGYTFSWSIAGSYRSVITGCGPTDQYCTVEVGRGGRELVGTVTWTHDGQSATASSWATIEPFCGNQYC